VLPGFENLFIGHNSWYIYKAMMRIFKHYHFNVKDNATAAHNLSFSSYPGLYTGCWFLTRYSQAYAVDYSVSMSEVVVCPLFVGNECMYCG